MKATPLLAAAIAVGLAACGQQSAPPPAPKTEAKPAAATAPAPAAPMPPAAPSAPPASAGQDAAKK